MVKVIKSENEPGKVEKFKGGFSKMSESFKANKKTWVVIICAVVLIIGAIWLNVELFAGGSSGNVYDPSQQVGAVTSGKDDTGVSVPKEEEESYFALAVINRTQAYDSAYETLLSVTTSATATDEAKDAAFEEITAMAENKQLESNIETLVKAKGFKECIAVISDGYIDVIVMSDGLLANEVAQIQEIVLKQTGITPANVTIIERAN